VTPARQAGKAGQGVVGSLMAGSLMAGGRQPAA
jgi:hypothetical protein